MKIKTINPSSYFIDWITVNWKLPFDELCEYDRERIRYWFCDFKKALKQLRTISKGYRYVFDLPKFQHYNIRVAWHGEFWAIQETKTLRKDVKVWLESYLNINEMIESEFFKEFGEELKRQIHVTVSRLDIARNHKGDLQNVIPIHNPNIKEISQQLGYSKKKPYITGIAIGKRQAESGGFFRAYDKRFDIDGFDSSLKRFKTINYVRKEWEIKRRRLRSLNICHPMSLAGLLYNKKSCTEIIYRLRLQQDAILETDSKLYTSIHDDIDKKRINPNENYTMSGHEYNKMLKKDYKILLRRNNINKIKRHYWNPFKQINSLIESKGQYLSEDEILKLITNALSQTKMTELEVNNYENKVDVALNTIKKDKRIKTKLKALDYKKKEINLYTKELIQKQLENN